MNYLQLKKRAFMKVVNSVKGIVRTASGIPPLMLEGCVDKDSLIGYTIYGNNTGDYDEASGKYKIPVICRGKNIFPYPYSQGSRTINGITITINDDSSVLLNGTATAGATYFMYQQKTKFMNGLNVGDRYTVSKNADDENQQSLVWLNVNFYDETGAQKTGVSATKKSATGTVSSTWVGMNTYIYIPSGNTLNNLLIRPMIERGSTATEYEPYVEPVTTNIYLDEPLMSGESISYPDAPKLPTVKGTTVYEVDTTVQPSQMDVTYYSTEKGD